MRLTVLGSGSCELWAERSSPAYLVEAGGQSIMLDLGQGAWRRLLEAGRDPAGITAALLSHLHPDHLGDLLPLLFALNYDPRMRQTARLVLAGPAQLQGVLDGLEAVWGHWVSPPSEGLERRWLAPGQETWLGPMRVRPARAAHTPASLAYRLEHGGASLVYLGDSEASPELVELAQGAGLVIAHCAGGDESPKEGHITPRAAGRLAHEAGAGALLLSHLYRDVDPQAAAAGAGEQFGGPVWAARDLMGLDVEAAGARPAPGRSSGHAKTL